MAGQVNKTSRATSATKADVVKVEVVKPYDGIPAGLTKSVKKDFPYLGYMVKEGYWKKID